MEQATVATGGRLPGSETVNDVLPGYTLGNRAAWDPERKAIVDAEAETDAPIAASDAVTVSISRETLRKLTLGADMLREIWNTAIDSGDRAFADLIALHIDDLVDAGLVDAEDGRTSEAFDVACALGGIALGYDAMLGDVGSIADEVDDFDDDVSAAEQAFCDDDLSLDPDWPGDPTDELPRAATFGD